MLLFLLRTFLKGLGVLGVLAVTRGAAAALCGLLLMAGTAAAQEAPVAARDLPRGAVLVAADIASAGSDAEGVEAMVGWVTRRVIREGELLRPPAIAPAEMVRSGDTVQAVWAQGGMELRIQGRAMNSATAGERVTVRVDSRRRLEGVAVGSGLVRLDSP